MSDQLPTTDINILAGPQTTSLAERAPEVAEMFTTLEGFNAGWKMAGALCSMKVLPAHFQGEENRANCMTLLSLAHAFRHIGASPFMIAQQLVPVNGKYGWQGQFVIAVINASKRFAKDLDFRFTGDEGTDEYGCEAFTTTRDGREIVGTKVTWKMVKAEGWLTRSGSKWQTMPMQMFRYRAGAFFGRVYAGDLMMGFQTEDEIYDTGMKDVTAASTVDRGAHLTNLIKEQAEAEGKVKPETVAAIKESESVAKEQKVPVPTKVEEKQVELSTRKLSDIGRVRKDSVVDDVDVIQSR